MNGWEFASDLVTDAYWPVVAAVALFLLRKPLSGLIDRIRRGKSQSGWQFEADPGRDLLAAIEAAVKPSSPVKEIEQQDPSRDLVRRDTEHHRREVEHVARTAAIWGQQMAELMPPWSGRHWLPVMDWSPDGSVRLAYGTRDDEESEVRGKGKDR